MNDYTKNIEYAINSKNNHLSTGVLNIGGYTSVIVECFLNNLLNKTDNVNYLEIGLWKGATFISALFGNNFEFAVGIDNSSEFGNVTVEREKNINMFIPRKNVKLINKDCFSTILDSNKFNIFFYDGNHTYESQKKAFTHFDNTFTDTFIAIIDDWNLESVRKGTLDAFNELNYEILDKWEINTLIANDPDDWWDGLGIFVIKKGIKNA